MQHGNGEEVIEIDRVETGDGNILTGPDIDRLILFNETIPQPVPAPLLAQQTIPRVPVVQHMIPDQIYRPGKKNSLVINFVKSTREDKKFFNISCSFPTIRSEISYGAFSKL